MAVDGRFCHLTLPSINPQGTPKKRRDVANGSFASLPCPTYVRFAFDSCPNGGGAHQEFLRAAGEGGGTESGRCRRTHRVGDVVALLDDAICDAREMMAALARPGG